MRNPFRRNKSTTTYTDKVIAELVIGTADGVHQVRVTVEYSDPRAALVAVSKLGEGKQLHDTAVAMGVHTCLPRSTDTEAARS